jgi:hypothetical protein
LIVGDLFDETQSAESIEKLVSGSITIPLPTYFSVGKTQLPEAILRCTEAKDGEVCENLFFIGRKGLLKTVEGLRVAFLGGSQLDDASSKESIGHEATGFTVDEAENLSKGDQVHILVTSAWPTDITKFSKTKPALTPNGSELVAKVNAALKPKYHFSFSEGAFYEREPFFQEKDSSATDVDITRFISLAQFGNVEKQKWIYAFTLDTSATPSALPDNITTFPFASLQNRKRLVSQSETFRRFSKADGQDNSDRRNRKKARHRARSPPKQEDCFFCLSFKKLEKHLILSIGEEAYLAAAKGPLPQKDTFPSLNCSAHILIVPLVHTPTLSSIPDDESKKATESEMKRYMDALVTLCQSRDMGLVCWRLERSTLVHAHWQAIPFPQPITAQLVREAFIVEGENDGFKSAFSNQTEAQFVSPADVEEHLSVFIAPPPQKESSESTSPTSIILPLSVGQRFDAQFGRRVMAKLLGLDGRANWKSCSQSFEEEVADAQSFKTAFKKFDFSESGE